METENKKGKVGRPKGAVDYFEDTAAYQIRLRKKTLKRFLDAFKREKARRKLTQKKGYFVNGVLTELLIKYYEAATMANRGSSSTMLKVPNNKRIRSVQFDKIRDALVLVQRVPPRTVP